MPQHVADKAGRYRTSDLIYTGERMTDDIHTQEAHLLAAPASEELEPPHPLRTGPRPHRRPIVPLWAYGLAAALVALLAVGVGVSFALNRSVTRTVPNVVGLDAGVARTRLRASGFEFATGDTRFSTKPPGTVLEQNPARGDLARRGSAVRVVVSGGTEEFRLPDIVGDGIVLGRGVLEGRGLEVQVNAEASDRPKDTVLSTNPSADSVVHTGDIILVTIAAAESVDSQMIPYRFPDVLFVVDPSKPTTGTDVSLEVSRRLRSLLDASGASVVVTRELADTDASITARATRAHDASATAVIGIDVTASGRGGFGLSMPVGLPSARQRATRALLNALSQTLTLQGSRPTTTTIPSDAITSGTTAPVVRVSVGALSNREDAASFSDPAWADQVARSIYRALGESYGHL